MEEVACGIQKNLPMVCNKLNKKYNKNESNLIKKEYNKVFKENKALKIENE